MVRRIALPFLCALLAGCALLPGGAASQVTEFAPGERPAFPELALETVDGREISLDAPELAGPLVVNFWASWCGPCRTEAPHLNAVDVAYRDQGLRVVGVNARDERAAAQSFIDANGLAFPSLYDPSQQVAAALGKAAPLGLPTTLVLDAEHRVAVRIFGSVTGASLSPYLDTVLAEAPRS